MKKRVRFKLKASVNWIDVTSESYLPDFYYARFLSRSKIIPCSFIQLVYQLVRVQSSGVRIENFKGIVFMEEIKFHKYRRNWFRHLEREETNWKRRIGTESLDCLVAARFIYWHLTSATISCAASTHSRSYTFYNRVFHLRYFKL